MDALVKNDVADPIGLFTDCARDVVVIDVDQARRFIEKPFAVLVHQNPVGEVHHQGFSCTRARIEWLSMVRAKIARRRSARGQCHANTFALVVVAPFGHWAYKLGGLAKVLREHFGVALKTARGDHHGFAMQQQLLPCAVSGDNRRYFALTLERARRGFVQAGHPFLQRVGAQRFDHGEAATHRH